MAPSCCSIAPIFDKSNGCGPSFGVKPNGQPYAFSLMGNIPPEIKGRVEQLIWNAISGCEWVPGADAQGRPTAIYVTFPLRFTAG